MEFLIIIFIAILVIAALYYLSTTYTGGHIPEPILPPILGADDLSSAPKTGASESSAPDLSFSLKTGADDSPLDDVMSILAPYIDDAGTLNIIDHLHRFYDYTSADKTQLKKQLKSTSIQYTPSGKKYLALLIQDILDNKSIYDPHEFIKDSYITYAAFVKPATKARIAAAVHPYTQSDLSKIRDLTKQIIREKSSSQDPDNIIKQIEPHRIYRIKNKKFEPDPIALRSIITDLVSPNTSPDVDKLIDRIRVLHLLRDYPMIRIDRIRTMADLLDQLKTIKPLDPLSYLEGKRVAEQESRQEISRIAEKDKALESQNEKLKQEASDKQLAEKLQADENQAHEQREKLLRDEFDKLLDKDPVIQQQIRDGVFTREQLFESYKKTDGGDESAELDLPTIRIAMLKFLQDIKDKSINK
jgi:hypothetical protein